MAATLTSQGEQTETVWASFPIEKVESDHDGNVLVWGKATDDSVDSDSQIVDPDFAAKAIDEWLGPDRRSGNVRVQHQANRDPAGVGVSFEREGNAHWVKSRIIEPVAKQLVLGGALRAYSVGIARPTIVRDGVARGGRITDGQIVEISLVDRPANKNCGIQLVKGAGGAVMTKVFGSGDLIAKMTGQQFEGGDVTVTLPSDVQVGFSPMDLARIVGRRNGHQPSMGDLLVKQVRNGLPSVEEAQAELDKRGDLAPLTKRKLTTETRNALPDSDFVFPEDRSYPIHDKKHARNALARVSQHGTPEEKARVRAAVRRRYPGIEVSKKTVKAMMKAAAAAAGVMGSPQTVPSLPKGDDADAQVWAHLEDTQDALNAAIRDQHMDTDEEKTHDAPLTSVKKKKSMCPSCGAKQNRRHVYCAECGKAMMGAPEIAKNHDFICTHCGYELDKGEKFCPHCGKPNPGHNPMADLKIPANKADGSRVADVTQAVTSPDGDLLAKKKKKKGAKGAKPFGGLPSGPEPEVFNRDAASKGADLAIGTSMRLKNLGTDQETGYAHDLVCPAFSWDDVAKSYPAGLDNLNADAWQQKALDAASSAPLAQAQAASRLGQAVFTIKMAAVSDLIDVKNDLNKAFRDANPGPGSAPTPGHITAQSYRRPKITTGRAAYSHEYDEHGIHASVPEGQTTASHFGRPFMQEGRAEDSPANKAGVRLPVPAENGKPVNLDYSNVHKEQILQAYSAMHDHFDRVFPGVCPMNAPASGPSPHPLSVKTRKGSDKGLQALTDAVIALPDTIKGEVVNALAGQPAGAAAPSLDRKDIEAVLRKSQKSSDRKFSALTDAVSILAEQAAQPSPAGPAQPALDQAAVAAVLRKAQKASDKRLLALTEAVSALPGTIRGEVASVLPAAPGEPAKPDFDRKAVVAVLRKAQKESDKRFLTLTEAMNALPAVIKGEVASAMPSQSAPAVPGELLTARPAFDRKAVAAVVRKAQKTSDDKIMALTEAVSALAEQSPAPSQPGAVRPGLDRKTIAAVVRKAQRASDSKITALTRDRKTIAAALRKAQKTSDEKFSALADTVSYLAARPSAAGEPAQPAFDRKAVAAVLRKAQKSSDRKFSALTEAVNALAAQPAQPAPSQPGGPAQPAFDRKAVAAALRKAQKTSNDKIRALTEAVNSLAAQPSPAGGAQLRALTDAVNALSVQPAPAYRRMPLEQAPVSQMRVKSSRPADARVGALKKAQKAYDEKLAALTKAVNVLADQPDPASQPFKGMAVNPLRNKSASPAGAQTVAEIAERTQSMMLHELEAQWRNSTDPTLREAAWNASMKMRGLLGNSS